MKKKLTKLVALAVCLILLFPAIALAIDDPDGLEITAGYVFDDLLKEGDVGILIDYFIDYTITGNPTETTNEAYLGVFVDTDGITQLKATAPVPYDDMGYGRGIIWIYFTAAEAATIDRADIALYKLWLAGNPTLSWDADPPKVIAGIDYWQPVDTNTSTLLALRIMSLAKALGIAWIETLYEETPLGARLTAMGEEYFTSAIPDLRLMAPGIFSAGTSVPVQEDLDYSTNFGATIEDGTGTLPVTPLVLVEGANTVTITGTGTFLVELVKGTEGTAVTDADLLGAVVTSSPVDLRYGLNTITVTQAGTDEFTITVNLVNTQTAITDTLIGTVFDLSDLAAIFGLSTMMMSGIVWLVITILVCAAVYKVGDTGGGMRSSGGKTVLLVFDLCLIGGAILGLLPVLAAALLFIGFGALTGYVLFFKGASF